MPEALISVAACAAALWLLHRVALPRAANGYRDPNDDDRLRHYAATRSATAEVGVIRPGAVETAMFLLTEAKASLDLQRSISEGFVAKGTTLLGLAAGASGALGVLTSTHLGSALAKTPLTVTAMICLVIAIGCALYLLRAKRCEAPDIGPYISSSMISEDNRCGLALTFALCHWKTARQLSYDARHEPLTLVAACIAINAAAILILASAATTTRTAVVFLHGARNGSNRSVLHPSAGPTTMKHARGDLPKPVTPGADHDRG